MAGGGACEASSAGGGVTSKVCECERALVDVDADGVRHCTICGHRMAVAPSSAVAELADLVVKGLADTLAAELNKSTEPWIGVPAAAAHLACRPQRVYDLCSREATSGIPVRREGGRLLFRRSELDAWLAGKRAT